MFKSLVKTVSGIRVPKNIGSTIGGITGGLAGGRSGGLLGGLVGGSAGSSLGNMLGGSAQKSPKQLSVGEILGFMAAGEKKGEEVAGTTIAEAGKGRADVRSQLKQILEGNSAGANAMAQDQAQAMKTLKANQMLAGGGQMNLGQQQAIERQGARDLAQFKSNERRQALSDLSAEWRGAGADIMRTGGQYGSILTGAQPPAVQQPSNGLFTQIFGSFLS